MGVDGWGTQNLCQWRILYSAKIPLMNAGEIKIFSLRRSLRSSLADQRARKQQRWFSGLKNGDSSWGAREHQRWQMGGKQKKDVFLWFFKKSIWSFNPQTLMEYFRVDNVCRHSICDKCGVKSGAGVADSCGCVISSFYMKGDNGSCKQVVTNGGRRL